MTKTDPYESFPMVDSAPKLRPGQWPLAPAPLVDMDPVAGGGGGEDTG